MRQVLGTLLSWMLSSDLAVIEGNGRFTGGRIPIKEWRTPIRQAHQLPMIRANRSSLSSHEQAIRNGSGRSGHSRRQIATLCHYRTSCSVIGRSSPRCHGWVGLDILSLCTLAVNASPAPPTNSTSSPAIGRNIAKAWRISSRFAARPQLHLLFGTGPACARDGDEWKLLVTREANPHF